MTINLICLHKYKRNKRNEVCYSFYENSFVVSKKAPIEKLRGYRHLQVIISVSGQQYWSPGEPAENK